MSDEADSLDNGIEFESVVAGVDLGVPDFHVINNRLVLPSEGYFFDLRALSHIAPSIDGAAILVNDQGHAIKLPLPAEVLVSHLANKLREEELDDEE